MVKDKTKVKKTTKVVKASDHQQLLVVSTKQGFAQTCKSLSSTAGDRTKDRKDVKLTLEDLVINTSGDGAVW